MGLRRTSHAVYDSQYPLVWAPKYRKWILRGDLRAYVGKLFHRISYLPSPSADLHRGGLSGRTNPSGGQNHKA